MTASAKIMNTSVDFRSAEERLSDIFNRVPDFMALTKAIRMPNVTYFGISVQTNPEKHVHLLYFADSDELAIITEDASENAAAEISDEVREVVFDKFPSAEKPVTVTPNKPNTMNIEIYTYGISTIDFATTQIRRGENLKTKVVEGFRELKRKIHPERAL